MAEQVSWFFLVSLLFSCSVQIHARDSFFFTKLTHYSIDKHHEKKPHKHIISPAAAPTLSSTPAPAPAFAPTTTLQSSLDESEVVNQELSGFGYQNNNDINNNEYKLAGETFSRGYENYNYNSNGYSTNYRSSNNGYSTNYKSGNDGYYEMGRQGMSDTRSLENGRYYYDVKNDNKYYSTGYESSRSNGRNYYGNSERPNELNSIEEYQNQEEYQESPEDYVP